MNAVQFTLHPDDGPREGYFLSPEWIEVEFWPFFWATLLTLVVGGMLYGVLYGYDRYRHDNPTDHSHAFALLWIGLYHIVAASLIGGLWDAAYHAERGFDSFYSAPHMYVYVLAGVGTLLIIVLGVSFREWFGGPSDLALSIPEPLAMTLLGLVIVGVGGAVVDNVWHTLFGLDETQWSFPHNTIAWGTLVASVGFTATVVELGRHRGRPWWITGLVGYLFVVTSVPPILGPFAHQLSIDYVNAVAATPGLQTEAGAQDVHELIRTWQLVRGNPLLVPLVAVWGGLVIGFLRRLTDDNDRLFIGIVACHTVLGALGNHRQATILDLPLADPATWVPISVPVLCAAITLVGTRRLDWTDRTGGLFAGGILAITTLVVWTPTIRGLVLVIPAILLFVRLRPTGSWVYDLVETPRKRGMLVTGAVAIAIPLLTGLVDLYLRWQT
jgi:hypothetical protein